MNAKKLCCLITITPMLFFGLPAIPFANVDRAPQLSQEELGLVFQKPDSTWNGKPEFLKYLDEKEMKETEGKWVSAFLGAVGGGAAGAAYAYFSGGNVAYGAATGALTGLSVGSGMWAFGYSANTLTAGEFLATVGLSAASGAGVGYACGNNCHGVQPQGEH